MSETDRSMTPSALLQAACDLLDRDSDATAGRWPRAAAILARQALEVGVDELCRTVHDDLGDCRRGAARLDRRGGPPGRGDRRRRATP